MNRHFARLAAVFASTFGGLAMIGASTALGADRVVPDLGLVINVDGDNAFPAARLVDSTKALQAEIDGYADANVKTLCYSVAAGSDIMLYSTKVADTWGWRKTPYDEQAEWKERIERMRSNMAEGGDALRTAGERAKARGMFFFPSQRMNDAHYCFGKPPEDYPLSGSFWLKHRDLTIGTSPIKAKPEYGELLDYTHREVRAYRLNQIFEAIDRYQDLIDGFELDFSRFQIFFPQGQVEAGAPLMTDLVKQVRAKLDSVGAARGRTLALIVRVPPTPKNCRWSGLAVEEWVKQGIVDVIVPSQMMTMGFEQPIDEFKAIVGERGPKVYATLLPRVSWSFPFAPPSDGLPAMTTPDRALTIDQLRGAVENSYFLKSDGLYLFNFQHYTAWAAKRGQPGSIDLNHPESFAGANVVFSITKAYWCDNEDSYEYRKQLPSTVAAGSDATFKLLIGAEPENASTAECWLRIGLREPNPDAHVSVTFNGTAIVDASIVKASRPSFDRADDRTAKIVRANKDLPTDLVLVRLVPTMLARGQNTIVISLHGDDVKTPLNITDIDVGLFRKLTDVK